MKGRGMSDNRYSLLKNDFFIKRVSGKFIIHSVISVIFVFAGSFIDTLIVGMYMGADGLSAMSLISPVYLVFYTVGATVGIGASILASRVLGKGEIGEYKKIFTCTTVILGFAAVIMTGLSYILIEPITNALCGNVTGDEYSMVMDYLKWYFPGGGFTLLTYVPLYFLKTDGKPKLSSRLFALSAIMNVILSWFFMSPYVGMSTGGASLATSVSMGTVAVAGYIILLKGNRELRFVRKSFSLNRLKNIVLAGIPNGLSNLLSSARIMMINMLLIYSGASVFLSCFTVVRNVSDILGSIMLGISSAIIPLVGVYFGERDYDGDRSVMRLAKKIGLCSMVPLVIIVGLLSKPLFVLFGVSDITVINEGYWAIPLACAGLIIGYLNVLYISYLTSIKREGIATVLVLIRLFAGVAVFAFPLSYLFGARGIWLSLSLAEILTFVIFMIIRLIIRKKDRNLDAYFLDVSKEQQGDISFSVKNDVNDIVHATENISAFCEDNDINMRLTMRVSLAIEEILSYLNSHCLANEDNSFTDVRVCKINDEVMVRFRYVGAIYDLASIYSDNENKEEMQDELLGLKMVFKSATLVDFRQTLGANNLIVFFGQK